MVVLYLHADKPSLDLWERRIFITLTILFSSLVSLSVGSLLVVLGAALRWPLLASRGHTPREVDLILSMANPSGSLRLLGYYSGGWDRGRLRFRKWKATTWVVLLYLVVNIIGRLSIAIFGLSYGMNESVVCPVMVNDFGNKGFMQESYMLRDLGGSFPTHVVTGADRELRECSTGG